MQPPWAVIVTPAWEKARFYVQIHFALMFKLTKHRVPHTVHD